ncbi:TonB-dependent receptor [Fulvivirgaceae bacterium BMA10]|uniref:TonB-dependent receptor n=1 Tax=Splendidivirga corallicola TaxID=3051826 RepID=A0ABT8KPS4_9BACT|nr:TonB-dependent receptor [Fulvivirgaceae bacterium BMA10]
MKLLRQTNAPAFRKIISKWLLIILLMYCGSLHAQQESSQILVNESFMGKTLINILDELSAQYQLTLDYDKKDIQNRVMTAQFFNDEPIENVLSKLLEGQEVHFTIAGDRKIIIRKISEVLIKTYDPSKFNFTLTGKVKDRVSGETLPFANIWVKSTQKGTSTNQDGFFTLLNVPSDTSTIIIQYMGYLTKELRLYPDLLSGPLVVEINPISAELEEVVITDRKEHIMRASEGISTISISPAQLTALPSLGEKDIFRSLQLLPGISATNETSSGLYVRGGTPDQNLVLFDGFTVYHVDHFYGFFSTFNANAVKDVQLYKGGFGAKYGGRTSSVVSLTGKEGNTHKFSLSAGISAISANATLEMPFADGKGSFLFAGRRSYTDIIKSGLYNDIFDLFNEDEDNGNGGFVGRGGGRGGRFAQTTIEPAFFFHDLNTKISFRPSSKDIISLSFYNGQDNLDESNDLNSDNLGGNFGGNFQFQNSTTDITKWGNVGSSLKWGRQWNDRLYSNIVLAYSNYFSDRDLFSETEITRSDSVFNVIRGTVEDNDLKDFTLRLDNEYLLNEQHSLNFGTQITSNNIDYNLALNDTLNVLNRNDEGLVTAFYIQDSWKPTPQLTIVPGIRVSYYDVTEQSYFEPRLSASYQLNDKIKLKGAWGKYYQFVNRIVREDVTQGSRDFWLLANDITNPVSSSIHYIAGVSYETEDFLFDVEAYHKEMDGLSEYSLRFSGPRSRGFDELFFEGSGYARGIEFLLQKKFGKFTGWVGYTLGEVIHEFPELANEPFHALHDQTHEFKIVNSFRLGNWTFAGTWVYATGKPYTAPIGGYELTLLDGTTSNYNSVGSKNSLRLPDYHRMDVSVTNNFKMGQATAEVGLSVFNLYNHTNVWYKTFEIIEDDVITTDVNTVGFTPNIFFNIKF